MTLLAYFFYTRIFKLYALMYKYSSRGVQILPGVYPILGNGLAMEAQLKKMEGFKDNPISYMYVDHFGKNLPKFYGSFLFSEFVIATSDPFVVEEFFITKNKFYDKHPMMEKMLVDFLD